MKKALIVAGMFALAGVVLTGCSSINTNDAAGSTKVAIVPAVYEPVIKHSPQKVEGSAKMSVLFGIFAWGASNFADRTSLDSNVLFGPDVKKAAVYNACKSAKCDMLLSSKYEVTTMDYFVFKTVECKVSGFPGTEVGIVKKELPASKETTTNVTVKPVPAF